MPRTTARPPVAHRPTLIVSRSALTADAAKKRLVCELSDLSFKVPTGRRVTGAVIDGGVYLVSPRTGNPVLWVVSGTDTTPAGDLAGWWMMPDLEAVRKNHALAYWEWLIIND